jgi:hypothetical protein
MHTSDELLPVVEKVDLLIAELKELRSSGPCFRIWHRFREPGCFCGPGEEIAGIFLVHRTREILVPLSVTLRLLFDFLGRHSHLPQRSSQIAVAMRADPFYRNHGANASVHAKLTRKISRASVKELIKRVRLALDRTFQEANLPTDSRAVLVSEETVTNQVVYRLRARCEWIHIDHP